MDNVLSEKSGTIYMTITSPLCYVTAEFAKTI